MGVNMGMPGIECKNNNNSICYASAALLQSIALEEAAIADILNAESEKLQRVINSCNPTAVELIAVNSSVESMVESLTELESVLKCKLELITPILEDCNTIRPHKDRD